jgi:pilus assembly protein CpaC
VATREIADVAAFPPDDLLITGKQIGVTQISCWTRGNAITALTVQVVVPTDALQAQLQQLFPDQRITVKGVGSTIVLSGQVRDLNASTDMEKVATAYAAMFGGGGAPGQPGSVARVSNLLQVGGSHQVQLEVRFAEVSRNVIRALGFNFWSKPSTPGGTVITNGLLSPGTIPGNALAPDFGAAGATLQQANGLPVLANPLQSAFSLLVATPVGSAFPLSATLNLMASRGFAKVLAEPTLVALSGQEANFLAGGEFPIPIPSGLGNVTVTYKKFGIALKFTPFVLGDQTVQLKMDTSVSDIDTSLGIQSGGVTVPGLTQRESATTVRLRDGQSFAIAGLLSDRIRNSVSKVPLLGDIPVLGMLFRSQSFRRDETELMVVCTVHLVSPLGAGETIQLPGEDEISHPGDLELFFLGTVESHKKVPVGRVGFIR